MLKLEGAAPWVLRAYRASISERSTGDGTPRISLLKVIHHFGGYKRQGTTTETPRIKYCSQPYKFVRRVPVV